VSTKVTCKAKAKTSGVRCKRLPIPGGTVCVMHGGKAPQVQRSARERLAALVDPAIARLGQLVHAKDERAALAASRDVLDRALGRAPSSVTGVVTVSDVRDRLRLMTPAQTARLRLLLAAGAQDEHEAEELRELRRAAGLEG
jgi:hypothetical protein